MRQPVNALAISRRKFRQERPEKRAIGLRAADGMPIKGLAYLNRACGEDRPLGLVERETPRVPIEPAMRHDAPRLTFEIADDVLEIGRASCRERVFLSV